MGIFMFSPHFPETSVQTVCQPEHLYFTSNLFLPHQRKISKKKYPLVPLLSVNLVLFTVWSCGKRFFCE